MPLVNELDLPVLDYTDPALRGDRFHETLDDLRGRTWICAGPLGYVVLEREAAAHFLRTRQASFPGLKIAELFDITEGPLFEEIQRNILHIGGDHHRRLRNLVNPAFTPRAADRWRPAMRGFLEELFQPVASEGHCELVESFAKPYPSLTIATVMGAPLADAPRLHHWSNWIQRQFDPPSLVADREAIETAVAEFYEYCEALLAARRGNPADDLISTLIAAEQDGDRLSDAECVNLVLNVLIGGVDTTQSQLSQGIRLFCEHPEQWELLRSDPNLVPAAVEEVLRHEPITPFTARIVEEEISYRDVTFPPDTVVMVCSWTANRDLEDPAGGDPDDFDITADRGREKPLTFGAGIHYCLGANLARAELQEALGFLAPRMPGLALDGEAELGSIQGIYGVDRLPIRWDPAPAA
ncbi:MAG TPA: cytochrome P450 [Thermoleophilaceae bacterium]|nr:cytochrome P450 [Thermoleophilaceae bacterium]